MFTKLLSATLLLSALPSLAQTVAPVSPTVANGQIQLTVTDSSGAPHQVSVPYTVTLSVGPGVDSYTPPPPPPPPPVGPTAPVIPATAVAVDLINPKTAWKSCEHDAGTPGTATCAAGYPVTGITADAARSFSMTYTGAGGARWAVSFAKDTASTNFVYDLQVLSPDWTHVANLELDTNQVKANGKTAILGTQCSSYSKTWEVTLINPATGKWHWVPSNIACIPLTWAPNVTHHVRIFGIIDSSGVATYKGVELDGVYSAFTGASGQTGEALGWSVGSVLENLQIDGLGASGSATLYADKLTIYRW